MSHDERKEFDEFDNATEEIKPSPGSQDATDAGEAHGDVPKGAKGADEAGIEGGAIARGQLGKARVEPVGEPALP